MANQQERAEFRKQIAEYEKQLALEEQQNPLPRFNLQLSQLVEMLRSDQWERSRFELIAANGIFGKPEYTTDPATGETCRVYEGFVYQYHKHIPTGFELSRHFSFRHLEGKPETLVVQLMEGASWFANRLTLMQGNNIINDSFEESRLGEEIILDFDLEEHLTPQIEEAFKFTIDPGKVFIPVYHYIDEGIKSDVEVVEQWLAANEQAPNGPYRLSRVKAVYAGLPEEEPKHYAFAGLRIAHPPEGKELDYGLYLTVGGSLVWLNEEGIFIGKDLEELPVEFSDEVQMAVQEHMSILSDAQVSPKSVW